MMYHRAWSICCKGLTPQPTPAIKPKGWLNINLDRSMVLHDIILKHSENQGFGSLFPGLLLGHSIFPILRSSNHWLEGKSALSTHISIWSIFLTTSYNAPETENRATEKPSMFEASIVNMLMFHLYRDLPRIRLPGMQDPRPTNVGTMSLTRFHEHPGGMIAFNQPLSPWNDWCSFLEISLLKPDQNHHSCGVCTNSPIEAI